jgi:steroid 5-alpha reductase family enzyme
MDGINQLWQHAPYLGMMLYGFAVTTTMMLFVWMVSEKINNAGIVDVFWGYGFFIVTAVYETVAWLRHDGWMPRKILILLMVALWSLRLGTFLYIRFRRHYPKEDGRYAEYRRAWGDKASLGMLGAFQMQAVLLAVLTLPFALIILNGTPQFYTVEIVSAVVWLVAFIGESLADHQAETFKKDPANKDKVCQVGLWNYSRHPNYFFEWLTWVAFFFFALPTKGGINCAICPVLMYYFLTRVTGVKATEEQALRTRGDAYREYQKTTSSFFPWFKVKS